ncbi:hypothetical protein LJR219_004552 [Phenylobacterium sp. LjRoot219]|uniref:hypothetical protein n=1 Tax=Phenylobacterium sp. LjRoot219 TaxID=3342283 RepID=UPI003ECD2592
MKRALSSTIHVPVADRLIAAGERLIGLHGLDGVTLRQLSLEAGTGNNYAVQYHFGDLPGLVDAILAQRMPEVERMRGRLLAQLRAQGALDLPGLVRALLLPPLELYDEAGERSYARFTGAIMASGQGVECITRALHLTPVSDEIIALIAEALPGLHGDLLRERLRLVFLMVLTSVFNRWPAVPDPLLDGVLIENALSMASAALAAPAPAGP